MRAMVQNGFKGSGFNDTKFEALFFTDDELIELFPGNSQPIEEPGVEDSIFFHGVSFKAAGGRLLRDDCVALALAEERVLGPGVPLMASKDNFASAVLQQGVARISNDLRASTAEALLDYIEAEWRRRRCTIFMEPFRQADLFSYVQMPSAGSKAPRTRWDFQLPLTVLAVQEALSELLSGKDSSLGRALEEILGSDAELFEVGAAVTIPGAAPQVTHSDTRHSPLPNLLTAFVALQKVEQDMGPTRFLLKTNTAAAHTKLARNGVATNGMMATLLGETSAKPPPGASELSPAFECVASLLDVGDVAVYDASLLHSGGGNRSDRTRILLHVTFRRMSDGQALPAKNVEASSNLRLSHFRRQ